MAARSRGAVTETHSKANDWPTLRLPVSLSRLIVDPVHIQLFPLGITVTPRLTERVLNHHDRIQGHGHINDNPAVQDRNGSKTNL